MPEVMGTARDMCPPVAGYARWLGAVNRISLMGRPCAISLKLTTSSSSGRQVCDAAIGQLNVSAFPGPVSFGRENDLDGLGFEEQASRLML